jgi:hypothetical protein
MGEDGSVRVVEDIVSGSGWLLRRNVERKEVTRILCRSIIRQVFYFSRTKLKSA